MTATRTAPSGRPTSASGDPDRYRAVARESGVIAALALLHNTVSPGVLPAGPGGHVLVPAEVAALCDLYGTPAGARSRAAAREDQLGRIPTDGGELIALRIAGAGPMGGATDAGRWRAGVAWVRLGLADRMLARAAEHLRGRTVQGVTTLALPLVRAALADAAAGIAEVQALLVGGLVDPAAGADPADSVDPAAGTDPADSADPAGIVLRQAHRVLDETGRSCLHLFGASGFAAEGPGRDVRASELLADAYAPVLDTTDSGDTAAQINGGQP